MIILRRMFGYCLLFVGAVFRSGKNDDSELNLYDKLVAWTYRGLADAPNLNEMERSLALQFRAHETEARALALERTAMAGLEGPSGPEQAITKLTAALEIREKAYSYCIRAECYGDLGEWDKALADHTRAIELDPDNAQYYERRAYAYFQGVHDYRKAIHDYKYLINLNPNDTEARGYLAMALSFFGSKAESLAEYKKLLQIDPNSSDALNGIAMALNDEDRVEEALPYYDRIVASDPDCGPYYNNRGMAYYVLGRYEEALRDLDKAVELNEDEVYFRSNRGRLYIVLDRLDEALVECSRTVELSPDFAPAWSVRGILHLKLGEPDKAEPNFERALKARFEDDTAAALFGRAIVKALRGDWNGARADTAGALKDDARVVKGFARFDLPQKEIVEELMAMPTGVTNSDPKSGIPRSE